MILIALRLSALSGLIGLIYDKISAYNRLYGVTQYLLKYFRILDGYSETSHIPKTVIVELALEDYLNKVAPVKKTTKASKK